MSTLTVEGPGAGWMRMVRSALGLTVNDLAFILDVNPERIHKTWERGNAPIPPGVAFEIEQFITFTDTTVDVLVARAGQLEHPAIVVYGRPEEIPPDHAASAYGPTWWDHVAFSVARKVPGLYTGTPLEVADVYDIPASADVHAHPCILTIPTAGDEGHRRIALRQGQPA